LIKRPAELEDRTKQTSISIEIEDNVACI